MRGDKAEVFQGEFDARVRRGSRNPARRRGHGGWALPNGPFVETPENTYPDGTPIVKPEVVHPKPETNPKPPNSTPTKIKRVK